VCSSSVGAAGEFLWFFKELAQPLTVSLSVWAYFFHFTSMRPAGRLEQQKAALILEFLRHIPAGRLAEEIQSGIEFHAYGRLRYELPVASSRW
jgi:hypothetical protein